MTIYYVGTSYANMEFIGTPQIPISGGTYPNVVSTSASHYNTNLLRAYAATLATDSELVIDLGTSLSDLWVHFDYYENTAGTTSGTAMATFFDASGDLLHGVVGTGSASQYNLQYSTNGTSFAATYASTTHTITATTRVDVDIHLKIHGTTGIFEVYRAGVQVAIFSGDTLANSDNTVRFIRLRAPSSTFSRSFSGIVVADVSTVGWRVQELAPAAGTQDYSDWTGTYTEIDDAVYVVAKGDSIYSNVVGDEETYPLPDVHASVNTMVPQAVVVCARAMATPDATPQNIELGLSVGGVFYSSGSKTVGHLQGERRIQHIWSTNPSTSSAWSISDVNALQAGFRAAV